MYMWEFKWDQTSGLIFYCGGAVFSPSEEKFPLQESGKDAHTMWLLVLSHHMTYRQRGRTGHFKNRKYKMKGNKQVCFKQNYIVTMGFHFKQMDSELEGILGGGVCVFSISLLFAFLLFFALNVVRYIYIKFTVLTISKCTVSRYEVHSYCLATITIIHLWNFFISKLKFHTPKILTPYYFLPIEPLESIV